MRRDGIAAGTARPRGVVARVKSRPPSPANSDCTVSRNTGNLKRSPPAAAAAPEAVTVAPYVVVVSFSCRYAHVRLAKHQLVFVCFSLSLSGKTHKDA